MNGRSRFKPRSFSSPPSADGVGRNFWPLLSKSHQLSSQPPSPLKILCFPHKCVIPENNPHPIHRRELKMHPLSHQVKPWLMAQTVWKLWNTFMSNWLINTLIQVLSMIFQVLHINVSELPYISTVSFWTEAVFCFFDCLSGTWHICWTSLSSAAAFLNF